MRSGATGAGVLVAVAVVALGGRGPVTPPSPAGAPFHLDGPPAGHTGGFGEPTCVQCHTEYEPNLPGGRLELEGLPARWEPGRAYAVVVSLYSEEMGAAGFQLSTRFLDGRPAGLLAPVDARIAVVDSGGVSYAQHVADGSRPESPELARWTVEWMAPATGGEVRFHAAANSANGDNSPLGDLIYTVERQVPPRR